jgi:hypothetical protein
MVGRLETSLTTNHQTAGGNSSTFAQDVAALQSAHRLPP